LTLEYTPGFRRVPERPHVHDREAGWPNKRQQRHAALLRAGGPDQAHRKERSARRIHFIKHAQSCGFTLAEIRELLELRGRDKACCGDVRTRAIEKKLQIEKKIRAMAAMSKALDQLIADCANEKQPVKECTIIAALERANLAGGTVSHEGRAVL